MDGAGNILRKPRRESATESKGNPSRTVQRSTVKPATRDPRWGEQFEFITEVAHQALLLEVLDHDESSYDEFLGQAIVELDELPSDGHTIEKTLDLEDRRRGSVNERQAETGDFQVRASGSIAIALALQPFAN